MLAGVDESEGGQGTRSEWLRQLVDGELGERVSVQARSERQRAESGSNRSRLLCSDALGQGVYRAHGIGRRVARVLLLVDVVEHLEGDGALIAHGPDPLEKPGHVENALAREDPGMQAPLAHVHAQSWRVGQLHVEDLLAGDLRKFSRVVRARQDMEAVQAHPECRVISPPNDAPRMVVRADAAPWNPLVGESQSALGGEIRHSRELLRREVVVVDPVVRSR
jgi:hypothetical protein